MKLIDFESIRKEREEERRREYIQSMVQLGQPELFDKLISEQDLTDEKIASCKHYIDFLTSIERDPIAVLEEVTFMEPMDFQEDNGVCWYEAIEAALTYYATLREHDKDKYNIALFVHPFVSSFD